MSGAKKKTLSKKKKQQKLQAKKKTSKQKKTTQNKILEKSVEEIEFPNVSYQDLSNDLKKMKAITPYVFAMKYSMKLSLAKNWLKKLEKTGIIQKIASSGSLKIYKYRGKS